MLRSGRRSSFMVAACSKDDDYSDNEAFHELAEHFLLAVAGGQFPSFEFIRQAANLAELLSRDAPDDLA